MAILKRVILGSLITFVVCFYGPAASAENAVEEFRIGLVGADPGQVLQDFDPFVEYLRRGLRRSGIRDITVFVARDLDQMHARIQDGRLDFIHTSPFPLVEMEGDKLVPSVLAWQGASREYPALFFVQRKSSLHNLRDLQGKTVAFGTPSSTAGYALAKAELKKNQLSISESTDIFVPEGGGVCTYPRDAQSVNELLDKADKGLYTAKTDGRNMTCSCEPLGTSREHAGST